MSETAQTPQLSGNLFLFERPELLTKESHGGLGFSQPEKRFGFCTKARGIPITAAEIPAAMKHYPIIVATQENPVLLAAVGIIDDFNLFVGDDGNWEPHAYIPAYLRRYPFGIASEASGERFAIVLDSAFEGVKAGGEIPLFDGDEPSENTKQAIQFCQDYERDRLVTNQFSKRLMDLGLLQGQSAQYTPQGATEPHVFAQYHGIEENKLRELDDETLLALSKEGALPLIYAMLMSMGNWRTLLERRARRFGLTEANMLSPAIN